MSVTRFTLDYSAVLDPGSICGSPTITPINPSGLTIPCQDDTSVDIEINTDVPGPYCLTFIIECSESCSTCPPIEVTKCFCVNVDDCEDCSVCTDNICVSRCAAGKICDDDTCVDCNEENPCPSNQICSQGTCRCPADTPILRADGKCVECLDTDDLGPCRICENGVIKSVICPNGHCDPLTGDCNECTNNSHCTEPNQCCSGDGTCDCCPGYYLDPITNECVPIDICTSAEQCVDQYGPCYYCTEEGCKPVICPDGFICDPNTGDCVPECGNCPEGYGCINGGCVPCSSLSCTGSGQLCQFATGCECNGSVCEYVNCNPDTIDLEWVVTNGTSGTVVSPGSPALQGTTSIASLTIVSEQPPGQSNYMNHQFNLAVTNATNGTWTLYNTPTSTVSLGSGTSVSFDLTQTGPNLVGFVVKFVENGTGRTATWGIYREITAPLTAANVWHYEFQSTGTPPTTTGGTSGSIQLCATNGNFVPTGVTNVQTTGDINITFFPTGANCLTAIITGCGVWNGDVVVECGGTTITVPAPEFTRDPSNCCDPTDPNCDGWGEGSPCTDLTVQPITLVALPTYGTNASGDGEFLVVADWTSAGLSFIDLFYLNPASGCWGTSDNPEATANDIAIVSSASQSPLGPSVSALSKVITIGDGGCIHLGKNCTLRISGCKRLEGELCMTECSIFTVDIIDLGSNTYKAVTSLADETITYTWSYPGLLTTTNQTVIITPTGGTTNLIVTAKYGTSLKCTATDVLVLNTFIAGCTDPTACNYDATANQSDNSCVYIGTHSYDCGLGFQHGTQTTTASQVITYRANDVPVVLNQRLDPGNYTITTYVNGVLFSRCSQVLTVPQCYNCASGVCLPAPSGSNVGTYNTNDCDGACACGIEINVSEQCASNRTTLIVSATGDTGLYTVTAQETGGANVLPVSALSTGSTISIPNLCNGNYTITVAGENCSQTVTYNAACFTCAGTTMALSNASISCVGNYTVTVTLATDPCGDTYRLEVLDPDLNVVGTRLITTGGTHSIPLGVYPGDGIYTVRATDIPTNNCITITEFTANCNGTLTECPITSSVLQYQINGSLVSFTESFTLDEAGGTYLVSLHNTAGGTTSNCNNATLSTQIGGTQTITGVLGVNTVNFINAIGVPPVPTCFGVKILRQGNASCTETNIVHVNPLSAPVNCGIAINSTSYNSATEQVVVGWDGTDTSGDLTIEINAYPNAVCGTGTPVTFTQSGLGEDSVGNVSFGNFPQLEGQVQCVEVTIFDTNDSTCTVTTTFQMGSCTCAIEILSTEVDAELEQVTVEYRTKCTSGDVTIDITGDATGSAADATASTDGVWVTNEKVIALTGYPATDGTISIEITDDTDAACTVTLEVVIEGNCESCTQAAALYLNDGTLTQIRNQGGILVVTGNYDLVSDEALLESDTETELVADGANFCDGATPVDLANSRNAGMAINQDNSDYQSIDHALIEHVDWVGTKKAYFGDFGCGITRRCDYTAELPISATADQITLRYAVNNALADYTGELNIEIDTPQTFDATALANIESDITSALGSFDVDLVTATYDAGTDVLTILIEGTNAGLSVIMTFESGGVGDVVDFTQSNCA